ncbi:MAG: glycosyltransferase family 87 protein [Gemmatimonadaceae bacterium]
MRLKRISARNWLLALYVLTIVIVAIGKAYGYRGPDNNFLIFRWSFVNLAAGNDMYAAQPQHHTDLYKYSPSFAVLFAPFALLPFALSLTLWDALNAVMLFVAVEKLLPSREAAIALALIYLEMLRSMQRTQSNSLVTALVILAFLAFEQRKQLGAAFAIAVGAAVKIFPLAALALAILYTRRFRFALMMTLAIVVVLALPLLVVSQAELATQYQSWRAVEAADALSVGGGGGGGLYGGVMQQLRLIFGVDWPNWPVQLAGTLLLLSPLVRWRNWEYAAFRVRFLAVLLVYMVIFNHQSESPSFVIAVTGIAIWFVSTPRSWWHTTVMVLTILVVSISSTDITPKSWQRDFFVHYRLKTIPCTIAWLTMMWELLTFRASERGEARELDVAAREALPHAG